MDAHFVNEGAPVARRIADPLGGGESSDDGEGGSRKRRRVGPVDSDSELVSDGGDDGERAAGAPSAEDEYECVLCEYGEDADKTAQVSEALRKMYKVSEKLMLGARQVTVHREMARIWNAMVSRTAHCRGDTDIPEISSEHVRYHRTVCIPQPIDELLMEHVGNMHRIACALHESEVWADDQHVNDAGERRYRSAVTSMLRVIQQLRGPVSSTFAGVGAAEKKYAQVQRMRRAFAKEKANESGAAGDMVLPIVLNPDARAVGIRHRSPYE